MGKSVEVDYRKGETQMNQMFIRVRKEQLRTETRGQRTDCVNQSLGDLGISV